MNARPEHWWKSKPKIENGKILCVAILDGGEETTDFFSPEELGVVVDAAKDAEIERLRAIAEERDAWRNALQSLTPGGSEFTEPQECTEYVRGNLQARWELLKKIKWQRDAIADAAKEATQHLGKRHHSTAGEYYNVSAVVLDKLAAALAKLEHS